MTCIVLAAGYATRLYPLTENFPKPLLKVGDKTILDLLLDDLRSNTQIDRFVVVSNRKFFKIFSDWAKVKDYDITVIDDGTTSNETRLGAVIDIQFAVDFLEISDDLLVIAGDNLLDFSMKSFIDYCQKKQATCIMRYFEPDRKKLLKCGVAELDGDRVIKMTEKSPEPKSSWCVPPFYYYKKDDIPLVKQSIEQGCKTDAPGSFIAYACEKTEIYAFEMPGKRYDIGTLESYEQVKNEFSMPRS